jgi:DNA repair protein SbcC/Rad50
MRLLKHTMGGFNHFSGRFTLDLAKLPGLVAIQGLNGAGKSSLALEGPLAGLFGPGAPTRAFASREGPLARYATSREAFIDDVWQLAQGTFRVRVNVDGQQRTTDAVLLHVLDSGHEVPLSDGKTSTFRQAVAERFPSQRSLLASAFSGQSRRGSFGELGQKERMELFVELADLAHLEAKAQTAKRCQQSAESVAARLRAALDVLRRASPAQVLELQGRLAQLDVDAQHIAESRATFASSLADAEAERARWQADALAHVAATERVVGLQQALARADADLAALDLDAPVRMCTQSHVQSDARFAAVVTSIDARRKSLTTAYNKATADREARIKNNQQLLVDADAIEAAVQTTKRITDNIVELRGRESTARTSCDSARAKLAQCDADYAVSLTSARELQDVRRRAWLLDTVKFGDACSVAPVCPLVTDAVEARERIASLEAIAGGEPELRESIAFWTNERDEYLRTIKQIETDISKSNDLITSLQSDVNRQPYLKAAADRIKEYQGDQAAALAALSTAMVALDVELSDAQTTRSNEHATADGIMREQQNDLAQRRVLLNGEAETLRRRVEDATAEASRLSGAQVALQLSAQRCQRAQEGIAGADADAATLRAQRAHLSDDITALQQQLAQASDVTERLRVVENEQLAWQTLATALGRDGLQRLEIDAAGPVVSDLANQLLEVGWGPRFGVAIVTQVATADKKDVKEKFTIEVLDNLHGGEVRDLGDLSGGERVVVEEAIRAALACYVNMRSRQPCRTLWRDEADGGLHADSGPQYIAMLRKLRELSGAEQLVFITHKPELAELADAVVVVADGQVQEIRSAA